MPKNMTFDYFESHATPVKKMPPGLEHSIIYQALAMCGEAGEAGNVVKKMARDGGKVELDEKFLEECGDTLFYMRLALLLRGFTLEDAAKRLLRKLDEQREEMSHDG